MSNLFRDDFGQHDRHPFSEKQSRSSRCRRTAKTSEIPCRKSNGADQEEFLERRRVQSPNGLPELRYDFAFICTGPHCNSIGSYLEPDEESRMRGFTASAMCSAITLFIKAL
jgi:hypothetical protein